MQGRDFSDRAKDASVTAGDGGGKIATDSCGAVVRCGAVYNLFGATGSFSQVAHKQKRFFCRSFVQNLGRSRATVSDGDQCHRSSGVQDFVLPERSTGRKPPYAKAKWMECEPVPSYRTCSMASQLLRCRPEAASFIGLGFDNVHTETTSLKRARMVLERTG